MVVASVFQCTSMFFVSAQLVSVRRLSALFPLRKFRSAANFKLKCLAWHVCLKFMFDNAEIMKLYGIGYFLFYLF